MKQLNAKGVTMLGSQEVEMSECVQNASLFIGTESAKHQNKKTNSGIYQIRNILDGKRYIGSAVNLHRRWLNHKNRALKGSHHSAHFQRAWDKDGADAFVFEILIECCKDEILDQEQYFIDRESPEYNIAKVVTAPMTGITHGVEAREKISASKRGKKRSADVCAAMSKRMKGKPANNKGKKMSPEVCARNSAAQKGKKLSVEHRKAISKGNMGRKMSPELVKNLIERMKGKKYFAGKKHSEEWIKNTVDRLTKKHEHNGITHTSEEWAAMFGITTKAFAARLRRWGNVDRIYVSKIK